MTFQAGDTLNAKRPGNGAWQHDTVNRSFYRFDRLITGITSPRYLLYPVLEADSVGVLYGDSMTFKTFVALEMAMAVASGETLHGWQPHQGAVFIIVGEGQAGIRRRLLAQAIAKDKQSLPIYVCTVPVALIDTADTEAMAEAIMDTIMAESDASGQDVTPRLIIIDTLTRNMGGGDESSNADINALLDNANRHFRKYFGACVLLVHHVGHSDKTRTRGAYSLLGNVDFQIRAERQPNSDTITLFCAKTKDAPEWEPIAFEALPVVLPGLENPDGTPVTSLTLRRLDKVPEPPTVKGKQGQALDVLRELHQQHRATLESEGLDPDTARVLRRDWQAALQDKDIATDRRRFYEIRDRLLGKRAIAEEHGYVRPL
jgi:hypothetical protein